MKYGHLTDSTSPQNASHEARYKAGLEPDHIVSLGEYVGADEASVSSLFGTASSIVGRDSVFEEVSRLSGAFVKPPADSDKQILIWGSMDEVDAAKAKLQDLVIKYRDFHLAEVDRSSHAGTSSHQTLSRSRLERRQLPRFKKNEPWSKLSVYHSIEKAHQKREAMALEELRKAPERLEQMNKLLFLWPDDDSTPQECLGRDLEKLDNLRSDLQVNAFLDPKNESNIIVTSMHDLDYACVAEFLRNLGKEAMRGTGMYVKKLMLAPVAARDVAIGIGIAKSNTFSKPFLQVSKTEDVTFVEQSLSQSVGTAYSRHFVAIEESLRTSLRGLGNFNNLLRLRFCFGSFVLEEYRCPENIIGLFKPSQFETMIGHSEVRGRLAAGFKIDANEMLQRFRCADDLLEPISQERRLHELELMEPTHSAIVEVVKGPYSQLRLELYLNRIGSTGEIETKGHRWFRTCPGEEQSLTTPLQLVMIDFYRADWQCTLKSFNVVRDRELTKAQQELASGIRFVGTMDNQHFGSDATMSIFVPKGTPDIRIVKKSAVQFKVKKTRLLLELSRFDIYNKTSFLRSQFGSTLYDPSWDTLMDGTKAGKGGSRIPQELSLDKLFPIPSDGTPKEGKANGLWSFLVTVQKIAELTGGPEVDLDKKTRDERMAKLIGHELGTLL
ncbi:hypothetical protein PDE_07222 [Penicillium oxalicum 114-2]|uniref:DUF7905 domain-containing protein n=1 Tax=Penicillium oxalicum (strain 114-2 / CGMCC 5302) TaxID=933388 RepID=S8BBK6_PENO1|nr:hypothetical protein PDE_07222 [Penicillium oxalicum 114-2]